MPRFSYLSGVNLRVGTTILMTLAAREYMLETGPDPSPSQQSITGMYYTLWGLQMEHTYPSDYDYQVCS